MFLYIVQNNTKIFLCQPKLSENLINFKILNELVRLDFNEVEQGREKGAPRKSVWEEKKQELP